MHLTAFAIIIFSISFALEPLYESELKPACQPPKGGWRGLLRSCVARCPRRLMLASAASGAAGGP